jgi:hypothetical protein
MDNPVNPGNIQNTVNQSVNQVNQAIQQPATDVKKKFPDIFKKKPLIFGVIALVILIIIVSVFSLGRNQTSNQQTTQNPQQEDILLATVGSEKVYRSDVVKLAERQYATNAINDNVIKTFFDLIIEQKILDQSAIQLGITVEASESAQRAKGYSGSAQTSQNLLDKAKYDLLKEKIMSKFISSRTAFRVSFWTPGADYPREDTSAAANEEIKKQQNEGKSALAEINFLIRNGQEPLDATKEVIRKNNYSTIRKIIDLNGFYVNENQNESRMKEPVVFTSKDQRFMGDIFYNTLFAMKVGETKLVFSPEGNAGSVFKVTALSDAPFKNYDEWLAAKKNELVKINNPL